MVSDVSEVRRRARKQCARGLVDHRIRTEADGSGGRGSTCACARNEANTSKASADEDDETETSADADEEWKQGLLETLLGLEPSAFERLAQRLLREAGFVSVQVTGKSGDGGIDGIGLLEMQLLSFPVFFQCKRYKGSVSAGAIRDFRGAMSGRGDKGLLITTGSFTPDAKKEARRPGAPPIDLIDGERLCQLLREHKLGVHVVEDVRVDPSWFSEL
jgi:restriction system protein